jgi:hypothetical protein
MAIAPPLSVGWGYGIVLGLGAVFAFGMVSHSQAPKMKGKLLTRTDPGHMDPQALQP